MADDGKKSGLTPSELTALLARLDEVMAEAARLRSQVTRQLSEERRAQQQRLSPRPRRKRVKQPKAR